MSSKDPPMVLFSVEGFDAPPSIADVAKRLGVSDDAIDPSFGVILVDPQRGMYCVQIPEDRIPEPVDEADADAGPWSSPPIAGFS